MYRSDLADSWLKMTAITRLSFLEDLYMVDTAVTVAFAVYAIWQQTEKDHSRIFDTYSDQPTVLNIAAISAFEPEEE